MENKFTWEDMTLCKECHYKNENPCLCNSENPPVEKPGTMIWPDDCRRFLKESKSQRMGEEHIKHFEYWKNK